MEAMPAPTCTAGRLRARVELRMREWPKCRKTFRRRYQKKCVLREPRTLPSFVERRCRAHREKIGRADIPWPASRGLEREVFRRWRRPRDTDARRIVR